MPDTPGGTFKPSRNLQRRPPRGLLFVPHTLPLPLPVRVYQNLRLETDQQELLCSSWFLCLPIPSSAGRHLMSTAVCSVSVGWIFLGLGNGSDEPQESDTSDTGLPRGWLRAGAGASCRPDRTCRKDAAAII